MAEQSKERLTDRVIAQDLKAIRNSYIKLAALLIFIGISFSITVYALNTVINFPQTLVLAIIYTIDCLLILISLYLIFASVKYSRAAHKEKFWIVADELVGTEKYHQLDKYHTRHPQYILYFKNNTKYNITKNLVFKKFSFVFYRWSNIINLTPRDVYYTSTAGDEFYIVFLKRNKIALVYNVYYFDYIGKRLVTDHKYKIKTTQTKV